MDAWSLKLDFELRHWRGQIRRLLGLHNTEVIALPQWDRGSFYASTPDIYSSYEHICSCGALTLPVFACCSGVFVNGTDTQRKVVTRIAELELSVFSFGAFYPADCVESVK